VQTHEGLNRVAYVYCKNAAHWHALAAKALVEKPEQAGGQGYFITNGEDGIVTVKELRDGIFRYRTRQYKYNTCMTNWVRLRRPDTCHPGWPEAQHAHHGLQFNRTVIPLLSGGRVGRCGKSSFSATPSWSGSPPVGCSTTS
jgi:hypothetical protein